MGTERDRLNPDGLTGISCGVIRGILVAFLCTNLYNFNFYEWTKGEAHHLWISDPVQPGAPFDGRSHSEGGDAEPKGGVGGILRRDEVLPEGRAKR